MDYYNILGVDRSASQEDLKKAYKKASMKHHPDRGGNENTFKEINEAYSTLKDPQKRQQYDNPQPQFNTQNMGGMGGFEDLFAQFDKCEAESQKLIEANLPLPAYEQVMKASHAFNLLDARHAISVTERQRYILRVRALSKACAQSYYDAREALGFPLCKDK